MEKSENIKSTTAGWHIVAVTIVAMLAITLLVIFAAELQREAFKAGLEARCGYSFTEEFIDKEFKKWKEKQQ